MFLILLTKALPPETRVEFVNQNLGYRVLVPKSWHIEREKSCEGDFFYEYEPKPFIDAYQGFSVVICVYKNTDNISVYGERQNTSIKIDGVPAVLYKGKTMIGVQHTLLIEKEERVYRIIFGLPFREYIGYRKEEEKANRFLQSFKFIKN